MNAETMAETIAGTSGPIPAWLAALRELELECARTFAESAEYWRKEAARYLVEGNAVMAGEALLNATMRETYVQRHYRRAREFGQGGPFAGSSFQPEPAVNYTGKDGFAA